MILLDEAKRRDQVLRRSVCDRDWDLDRERALVRHLVLHSSDLLPEYPLLVGVEWDAHGQGWGDLLFFGGRTRLAVVEVRHLKAGERTKRRKKVEEQARRFAEVLRQADPELEVVALVYTDDEFDAGAPPRGACREARTSWE